MDESKGNVLSHGLQCTAYSFPLYCVIFLYKLSTSTVHTGAHTRYRYKGTRCEIKE